MWCVLLMYLQSTCILEYCYLVSLRFKIQFMQTQQFSVAIDAPKEKVWNALWNDTNYRKWTTVFHEGSYMEATSLAEGADVRFLGPGGGGMYSKIDSVEPNTKMVFNHLGVVKDMVNLPQDEETKKWAGAKEKYFLEERNGKTELKVEVDMAEGFENYFSETFPKALQLVKEIAEA